MLDLSLSIIALLVLSPLLLMISLIIKLSEPRGKVLFKQKRLTRFDNTFYVYKFRSVKLAYNGKDEIESFTKMGRPDLIEEFLKQPRKGQE